MVSESVTGKINFLSKWGTGPGNETGAYELDLTLLDDFSKAWRPLHVKTDLFCAAGVVLPDKGGRQLTVGGWSGESTEGVRLYWPDGSPGVWGTHDWQENVNELSLQVGRWYPSALVMANGSVMVIGGEVGSNGAAVPSIEVLPYTGTAPLYMDVSHSDPDCTPWRIVKLISVDSGSTGQTPTTCTPSFLSFHPAVSSSSTGTKLASWMSGPLKLQRPSQTYPV